MSERPIFIAGGDIAMPVKEISIQFEWVKGMAITQQRKCADSLHHSARKAGYDRILEVSSKSRVDLGLRLSAFYLSISLPSGGKCSVESAYQGSKVFEQGGPFTDLYTAKSLDAKRDSRLQNSGALIGFNFDGDEWELNPPSAFYDWLYMLALVEHPELNAELKTYDVFTDISFNPKKQVSCQARSTAIYVCLARLGVENEYIFNKEKFLLLYTGHTPKLSYTKMVKPSNKSKGERVYENDPTLFDL